MPILVIPNMAGDSAFLLPRALTVQKSCLYLLSSYRPFGFLLNQSQWHIFTQCKVIVHSNVHTFSNTKCLNLVLENCPMAANFTESVIKTEWMSRCEGRESISLCLLVPPVYSFIWSYLIIHISPSFRQWDSSHSPSFPSCSVLHVTWGSQF